jgi:hypothetical protein
VSKLDRESCRRATNEHIVTQQHIQNDLETTLMRARRSTSKVKESESFIVYRAQFQV